MKKFSLFLIILSFFVVVNNYFRFLKHNTPYEIGDWLINYQGGFVRKGLIGEITFQIYNLTQINPALLIFFFVIFLYLIFYLVVINFAKNNNFDKLFILVLFSPLSFFFPVFNSKATGRKEILFISILSLICYFLPKINKQYYIYSFIFFSIIIGLTHEGFIFYFGYLLTPLIFLIKPKNFSEISIFFIIVFSLTLALMLITYTYSGSSYHVKSICNSLNNFAPNNCEIFGQISALSWDLKTYVNEKFELEKLNKINVFEFGVLYFIYGLISFLPFFLFINNYELNFLIFNKKIKLYYIFLIPLLFTLPVYFMVIDFGRYLYTSYISSLIILLFLIKNNFIEKKVNFNYDNWLIKKIWVIVFLVFCFGWTVPYCCDAKLKLGIFKSIEQGIGYYKRNGLSLPKYFFE